MITLLLAIAASARAAQLEEVASFPSQQIDLKTGKARRLLDGHKSTQPEPDVKLTVGGKELIASRADA